MKPIKFSYREFEFSQKIKTYNLESVASDKIGRILDVVNEPRDLYDLWYLLKQKDLNPEKVAYEFKLKYGYKIITTNLIEQIKRPVYESNWEVRLKQQMRNLPDYGEVVEELEKQIKISFK